MAVKPILPIGRMTDKEKRKHQERMKEIANKLKKQKKDKKFIEQKNKEWIESYASSLQKNRSEIQDSSVRPEWSVGNTSKKSIFEPTNFREYDTKEVDRKRKKLGLPSLEEGDKLAKEEIERKATRVAPLYNKGGYQYLSKGDEKDIGKKVNEIV